MFTNAFALALLLTCPANSLFDQAKALLAQKQYSEAAKALDQLEHCPQLSPLETFEMGWLYGRARQFQTAVDTFDRVSPTIPDRLTHAYAIALSQFELADYQGAIRTLETVRAQKLSDAKSTNLLAVAYSKLSLYKQAYAVLSEQLAKDPNDLATYLNPTTVCAEGGDTQAAANVASQGAARFPNSPDVLIVRGAARSLLGRTEEAKQDFAAAIHLAPKRADARFFLALMDYNQAEYPAALAVLKQAQQQGLEDPDLHYLAAETLLKIDGGDSTAALAELNQASASVAARTLKGRLLLERETRAGTRRIASRPPSRPCLAEHHLESRSRLPRSWKESASRSALPAAPLRTTRPPERNRRPALERNPHRRRNPAMKLALLLLVLTGEPHIQSALAAYHSGQAAIHAKHFTEAIQNFQKAIQIEPTYQDAYESLITAHLAAGHRAEAAAIMTQLLEINPALTRYRLQLAQILMEENQPQRALAQYSLVLKADPQNATALKGLAAAADRLGMHSQAAEARKKLSR